MIDLLTFFIFLGLFLSGAMVGLALGFGSGQQHILRQIRPVRSERIIRNRRPALRTSPEVTK